MYGFNNDLIMSSDERTIFLFIRFRNEICMWKIFKRKIANLHCEIPCKLISNDVAAEFSRRHKIKCPTVYPTIYLPK